MITSRASAQKVMYIILLNSLFATNNILIISGENLKIGTIDKINNELKIGI